MKFASAEDKDQFITTVAHLLKKPPHLRRDNELRLLEQHTSHLQLFAQMHERGDASVHRKCCIQLKHEYLREGKIVFDRGSIGDKFYIILSGRVGVYQKLKAVASVESQNLFQHAAQAQNKITNSQHGNNTHTKKIVYEYKMTCIKELGDGESFGEMALLSSNTRAARIFTHTPCHFAVLDKQAFDDCLRQREEEKLMKQMEFLRSIPIFQDWLFPELKNVYLNIEFVKFIKGDYVVHEGEALEHVFIIRSGSFTVLKRFKKPSDNSSAGAKLERQCVKGNKSPLKSERVLSKECALVYLQEKEFFAEDDVMRENLVYTYSLQCNTHEGELYRLLKRDFLLHVLVDEISVEAIKHQMNAKTEVLESKQRLLQQEMTNYSDYFYPLDRQQYQLRLKKEQSQNQSDQALNEKEDQAQNQNFMTSTRDVFRLKTLQDQEYSSKHRSKSRIDFSPIRTPMLRNLQNKIKFEFKRRFKDEDFSSLQTHIPLPVIQNISNERLEPSHSMHSIQGNVLTNRVHRQDIDYQASPKVKRYRKLLINIYAKQNENLSSSEHRKNLRQSMVSVSKINSYMNCKTRIAQKLQIQASNISNITVRESSPSQCKQPYQIHTSSSVHSLNSPIPNLLHRFSSTKSSTQVGGESSSKKYKMTQSPIKQDYGQTKGGDAKSNSSSSIGSSLKNNLLNDQKRLILVKVKSQNNFLDSLGDEGDPAGKKNVLIVHRPLQDFKEPVPTLSNRSGGKYQSSAQHLLEMIEKRLKARKLLHEHKGETN